MRKNIFFMLLRIGIPYSSSISLIKTLIIPVLYLAHFLQQHSIRNHKEEGVVQFG